MRPVIIWIVWMAVYVCNTAVLCILITGALKLTGLLPVSNIFLIFITLFNFGVSLTAYRYSSLLVPCSILYLHDKYLSRVSQGFVLVKRTYSKTIPIQLYPTTYSWVKRKPTWNSHILSYYCFDCYPYGWPKHLTNIGIKPRLESCECKKISWIVSETLFF